MTILTHRPRVKIDLRQGLSNVRSNWIEERDDTELLEGLSSDFANKQRFAIFTNGNVFHFRCNNALTSIMHLGDILTLFGASWYL
jgi:hypothetical protein